MRFHGREYCPGLVHVATLSILVGQRQKQEPVILQKLRYPGHIVVNERVKRGIIALIKYQGFGAGDINITDNMVREQLPRESDGGLRQQNRIRFAEPVG